MVLGAVLLAALGWWGFRSLSSAGRHEGPETLAEDDRIRWLVAPCGFTKLFDVDTSNMIHVLVESLGWGQRDALTDARQELAVIGESVLPELQRSFEASYAQSFEHGVLENVLGVCTIAEEPWGLELLRRGASHPGETVRMGAVTGLAKHGEPADYDLIERCLPLSTSLPSRAEAVSAMGRVDPERLGRDFVRWIQEGENEDLWESAAAHAGFFEDPDTVAQLAEMAGGTTNRTRFLMQAPSARDGDEESLAALRAGLGDGQPGVRELALNAVAAVGLGLEARGMLELDPVSRLRLKAASVIAALEPSEEAIAALSLGLSDRDADVRDSCLEYLCRWADERAVAQALESLRGTPSQRTAGLSALRRAFDDHPELVPRARAFVLGLIGEPEGTIDPVERGFLQVISQIPGQESAEFMLARARNARGQVSEWRAHRWCTHQATNTGSDGRRYLLQALESESDPVRRVDLIHAATQEDYDEARAVLRTIIEDPDEDPHVRVFASHRLIAQGPAVDVAPYLKRIYLASVDPILRPALHCMLWAAYGARRP